MRVVAAAGNLKDGIRRDNIIAGARALQRFFGLVQGRAQFLQRGDGGDGRFRQPLDFLAQRALVRARLQILVRLLDGRVQDFKELLADLLADIAQISKQRIQRAYFRCRAGLC